jgi:hypothetical protein
MQLDVVTRYQSALWLHDAGLPIKVNVDLGHKRIVVPAALVQVADLAEIFDGEKYAATLGGKFFVTKATPPNYHPFALFHELAEHAAPRGFDVTGKAAHYQALALELGYAKAVLALESFSDYLAWRRTVERTNFFTLDHRAVVEEVSRRIEQDFDSMSRFLTYRGKNLVDILET